MSVIVEKVSFSIKDVKILDNISLEFYGGELLTILGPNGSGKSSLLNILSGDLIPSDGKISFDNMSLKNIPIEKRAVTRSVMSQTQRIMYDFSVKEIIEMGWIENESSDQFSFVQALDIVSKDCEIDHLLNRSINNLSGGEQRRVHFARTLIQLWKKSNSKEPRYIFLDEPTANLDLYHEINLIKILKKKVAEGFGVFLILHDLNLAFKFSNRVAFLKDGKLVCIGSPLEVFDEKLLSDIYGMSISVDKKHKRVSYY